MRFHEVPSGTDSYTAWTKMGCLASGVVVVVVVVAFVVLSCSRGARNCRAHEGFVGKSRAAPAPG